MCPRPPRVAIVFDGGEDWTYWARAAIYVCTRYWGGDGFVLVPHVDGQVHEALLRMIRSYDPDYVVTLERTVRDFEILRRGSVLNSTFTDSEDVYADTLKNFGDQVIPVGTDDTARDQVAAACTPHRRRFGSEARWDESVTSIGATGTMRFSLVTDIIDRPTEGILGAPSSWGGMLGVAVAARCGTLDAPDPGTEPNLTRDEWHALLWWLMGHKLDGRGLPRSLVRHIAAQLSIDTSTATTAISQTRTDLAFVNSSTPRRPQRLMSVGDTATDFAIAYAYERMYGAAVWLPGSWWSQTEPTRTVPKYALHAAYGNRNRGDQLTVTSTSVDVCVVDAILAALHDPIVWSGDRDKAVADLKKISTSGDPVWEAAGIGHLVVDNQYNQDFTVPATLTDAGDMCMLIPCPLPVITEPTLGIANALDYQVDVNFVEAKMPHGHGLDGHDLLVDRNDQYLTWIRSGRDGATFESQRSDFVLAGTAKVDRLARPRLRSLSLSTWADARVAEYGYRMMPSAAGRREIALQRLWGTRASLAELFAGQMLPVLHAYRPTASNSKPTFTQNDGLVLHTGTGSRPNESYLTFGGITELAGASDDPSKARLRGELDLMLERGLLFRGLILKCAACRKVHFVRTNQLGQVNVCPRCQTNESLSRASWISPTDEPLWFYDLHPLAREQLDQDGDVPLLLSHYLRSHSRSYDDVGELELYDASLKSIAEADLIALSDGELIAAEVKRPGSLGTGRQVQNSIRKRFLLAEKLEADQIVLATAATEWSALTIGAVADRALAWPWPRLRPRLRFISALGSLDTSDVILDPSKKTTTPWPV